MKATLAEKPPRGNDWLFEVKWDGVRAIAFIDHEEVRLQSRSGLPCERQYPELAVIHHSIAAENAILAKVRPSLSKSAWEGIQSTLSRVSRVMTMLEVMPGRSSGAA